MTIRPTASTCLGLYGFPIKSSHQEIIESREKKRNDKTQNVSFAVRYLASLEGDVNHCCVE